MAKSDLGAVLKRIDKRLDALKMSDRAASIMAGMSPDGIRTMRRQWKSGAQKSATEHTISLLARPLQTSKDWLLFEVGPETIQDARQREAIIKESKEIYRQRRRARSGGPVSGAIKVTSEAASGRWFEDGAVTDTNLTMENEIPAHPLHPAEQQFAVVMRGNGINRVASEGDFLITTAVGSGHMPHHGDLVVVERTRGDLHEVSAKRYIFAEDDKFVELRNDSTDPQFQNAAPIRIPVKRGGEISAKADDDSHVVVKGVVLAIYRLP